MLRNPNNHLPIKKMFRVFARDINVKNSLKKIKLLEENVYFCLHIMFVPRRYWLLMAQNQNSDDDKIAAEIQVKVILSNFWELARE